MSYSASFISFYAISDFAPYPVADRSPTAESLQSDFCRARAPDKWPRTQICVKADGLAALPRGMRKSRPKVLSLKPMDWLTSRQPDEARPARETPLSFTEILPELSLGEYPRPGDAAWLRQVHGLTAVLNLQDDDDPKKKDLNLPGLPASGERAGIAMARIPLPDASAEQLTRCERP